MTTLDEPAWAKFTGATSNRIVSAVVATRGIIDGQTVDPLAIDYDLFLARGGAVLVSHDREREVASCSGISRSASSLIAWATFPPQGRDATADAIFSKIWNRAIRSTSAGLSFQRGARPVLIEWSFCAAGLNPECRILSGYKSDDSGLSGAHWAAAMRADQEERYSRQWRIE